MFKGDFAQPTTKKRRAYHQAYYRMKFGQQRVPCPNNCGHSMLAGRVECWHCAQANRWDTCKCGARKTKVSKVCRGCSVRANQTRRWRKPEANPHCPNELGGGAECETRIPHAHCRWCGWPVSPTEAMCRYCRSDVARGAAMTAHESNRYELAA